MDWQFHHTGRYVQFCRRAEQYTLRTIGVSKASLSLSRSKLPHVVPRDVGLALIGNNFARLISPSEEFDSLDRADVLFLPGFASPLIAARPKVLPEVYFAEPL